MRSNSTEGNNSEETEHHGSATVAVERIRPGSRVEPYRTPPSLTLSQIKKTQKVKSAAFRNAAKGSGTGDARPHRHSIKSNLPAAFFHAQMTEWAWRKLKLTTN